MKKIALCFLTINNLSKPKLWSNFLDKTDKYNIYFHNKEKFVDNENELHKYCIEENVPTKWGDISLVHATLKLFETAFRDNENKYFILLSDNCIPLYDLNSIYEKIVELDSNLISCGPWNQNRAEKLNDKSFFLKEEFMKQSQFFLLKRTTVEWFLNNNYTHIFGKKFVCTDEHYFINLLRKFNISYLNKRIMHVSWSIGSGLHPKDYLILTQKEIDEIKRDNKYCFFIRKINKDCILPEYYDL